MRVGVDVEGPLLVVEDLDPRMGVSAADRYAVETSRQNVGRGGHAADVRGPRGRERSVGPLGAAQPELQDRAAAGRLHDAGRLRGHERLEADDVEQHALDELGLQERPSHAQERFVGEDDRALGYRVDVAGELERRQAIEEGGTEERLIPGATQAPQVVDVDRVEAQALENGQGVVQPGRDGVAAAEWEGPEVEGEDGLAVGHARGFVAGAHGQLIEVSKRGQARAIELRYAGHRALAAVLPTCLWADGLVRSA